MTDLELIKRVLSFSHRYYSTGKGPLPFKQGDVPYETERQALNDELNRPEPRPDIINL